jgi:alpha-ketoglutarate-dependent taurine dioxygenase
MQGTGEANRFKGVKRKALNVTAEEMVKTSYLEAGSDFPLVMEAGIKGVNLSQWAAGNRERVERELLRHGAILFRGFNVGSVEQFEEFAKAISHELLDYKERSSPRSLITKGIYTSTDYPADQAIHFHNEQSYTQSWPMKLWFYCVNPADEGGATPIADARKVARLLSTETVNKFAEKKVMYVRNYSDGLGLPWQDAFQTTDRREVERHCRQNFIEFEWKDGNRLRTRQIFETLVIHPKTDELLWFEHAAFFHISSLAPAMRDSLLAEYETDELPFNTYYGDGSPIEDSVLEEIRAAFRKTAVLFSWQRLDILLIDNMLTSHSREPFVGPRKILVAMTELFKKADLKK